MNDSQRMALQKMKPQETTIHETFITPDMAQPIPISPPLVPPGSGMVDPMAGGGIPTMPGPQSDASMAGLLRIPPKTVPHKPNSMY